MFLHTFRPSSVLIDFGLLQIHWYGFLIASSVLIGFFIAVKLFKRYGLKSDELYNLGFYLIIFSILGARLWHVLSELDYYSSAPLDIFKIWQGGLAIHGAILAGALTIYIYGKIKKMDFWLLLDIFAPLVALGQGIGRWGNYFNQELHGRPLEAAWSIPIDLVHRLPGYESFQFFHPIFLYESLWMLLVFILLIILHRLRLNHDAAKSPCALFNGTIFLSYLCLYSLGRFLVGFLRIDPQLIWLNLRLDQWVSLIFIIFTAITYFILRSRHKVCDLLPEKK